MAVAPRFHLVDQFRGYAASSDKERQSFYDLSYSPHCVACVFRLGYPASASRQKLGPNLRGNSTSVQDDPADGVRLRGDPLVVVEDIVSATVQTGKGQHVHQLQLQLCQSPTNYLSAILPGDWIMCWMVRSREKMLDLVQRLHLLEPCNGFSDGLKFVGRVEDVGRDRASLPTGLNRVSYEVTALGFSELSSQIFYDPYLAEATPLMGTWLARIGGAISELLGDSFDPANRFHALDINKLIPFFLNLLVGEGVSKRFAQPSADAPELQIATGLTRRDSGEAPYAYTVPGEVGLVLGKRNKSRGTVLAYADVLELVTGVQRFTSAAGLNSPTSSPWALFTPDGVEPPPTGTNDPFVQVSQRKETGRPMLGEFIPTIPDFTNKDVWSVLRQWLNPTINEMYTALRTNEAGQVVPTVVVRQIPLSSQEMVDKLQAQDNLTATPMLEVPRWVGHPAIVRRDHLRRSNALRINFTHVYGQAVDMQRASRFTDQIVRNPPVRNDLDIQRSGLRSYMGTVNCSIDDSYLGPSKWLALASDWLLDQHLVLGGTLTMELVEEPIVHGDNFEYDGIVAHIEGVVHQFQCYPDGRRTASTSLSLTHGVRSDDDPAYQERDGSDSYIFSGLREDDCRAYDPGISVEGDRVAVRYENSATPAKLPGE